MERFKEEIKLDADAKLAAKNNDPFYKTQVKLNSFTDEVN